MIINWQVKVAIILVVLSSAFAWHKIDVSHQVEKAKFEVKTEMQEHYNTKIYKLKEDSDKAQKVLKDSFDTQLKDKNEKLKVTDSKYRTLLSSMSDRPERPSSIYDLSLPTGDRESPVFVDGSGLYRADAAFLIRYAVRTEGLKLELQACYKAYDTARDILERFKSEHQGM